MKFSIGATWPTVRFWRAHPALFFGFCLYIGVALGAGLSWWTAALGLCGWAGWRWSVAGVMVVALAGLGVTVTHRLPACPEEGLEGEALIQVEHLSVRQSFFGPTQYLRGQVQELSTADGCVGRRVPIRLYLPLRQTAPVPGATYQIHGRMKCSKRGDYLFKVDSNCKWTPKGRVHWIPRFQRWAKGCLKGCLETRLGRGQSAQLLVGLATGEFDDPELLLGFGRLGLQHLMAISGFHFSLLATVLTLALRVWLTPRKIALVLALLLSFYFLFIGPSPSVLRAWVMALIACLALLTGRRQLALNSLGIALLVSLTLNPLAVRSLGFQFSFTCTAALLAFCGPIHQMLGVQRAFGWALAATLSVNLAAVPLTLSHFHRFPVMGLATNLVFPVLISALMLMLGLALLLEGWFPILGGVSFFFVYKGADGVLWAVREMPAFFDFMWRIPGIPTWVLAVYGTSLVACAVWLPGLYPRMHGQARAAPFLPRERLLEGSIAS